MSDQNLFKQSNIEAQGARSVVEAARSPAVSHMWWFFIIPIVVFVVWAGVRLVSTAFDDKVASSPLELISKIKGARSSGDRWQMSYQLAQEIQKLIYSKEFSQLDGMEKAKIYDGIRDLLNAHKTDPRLKKYLVIMVGQMGEWQGLDIVASLLDDADEDVRFFASWSYIDLLQKNGSTHSDEKNQAVEKWLEDKDPSRRKIAATYLLQANQKRYESRVEEQLLNDSEDADVRWNAAVSLASVSNKKGIAELKKLFTLNSLRSMDFNGKRDLAAFLQSAFEAVKKSQDKALLQAAFNLKNLADAQTPEGRIIHSVIRYHAEFNLPVQQ